MAVGCREVMLNILEAPRIGSIAVYCPLFARRSGGGALRQDGMFFAVFTWVVITILSGLGSELFSGQSPPFYSRRFSYIVVFQLPNTCNDHLRSKMNENDPVDASEYGTRDQHNQRR